MMTHHHIENSEFALHNRKEIIFILEDLAKHRTPVNLDTHEGATLVTAVLGVHVESNQIFMDISSDEQVNRQIINSKHVSFVTQTGVKVRWHSTHLRLLALNDGRDAFAMHVPSVIERIQRREYFRLSTPQGSKAMICKIPAEEDRIVEVPLLDISVGGVGISVRGELDPVFSKGAILEGCSIDFPEIGAVPVNLRVCGKWVSINTKSGEQIHRIGLAFLSLSRGASNVIQRYMIQLEAEKISLA